MMLFKLSLKNIQKSFKDYAIYFFTLILGVAIFYVFNAIESQTILLDVTSSTYEIIRLMTSMLSGVSVFVSCILGFLVIYASRFLIKRRNKEFGIYLTLGMSKRKIAIILFIETLIIGILSLIVGICLGIILSQAMSLLVANMFEADMTQFKFIFSTKACYKTLICFSIVYLLVMLFNTFNISKCKLIDLLYSSKKSEKIKLKNPLLCTIVFIISCIILGMAYYLVTGGIQKLDTADKIFIPIIMGSVSTFFIFWSISGLLLKIFMSMKKVYYKGLNSFILRQFSSKINTTVFSMTIICLMLFITICVLSASLSLKNSMTANLNTLAPADIELTARLNMDDTYLEQGYTKEQIDNSNLGIVNSLLALDFDLKSYLKESIEFNSYQTPDLTWGDTLGNLLDTIKGQYRYLRYDSKEDIMKISDYNKVARLYGNKEYTLNENEYIIVADFESMVKIRNVALKNHESLQIFGHTLIPKYEECQEGFIEMSSNHINAGIILVADNVVDDNYIAYNHLIGNYKVTDKEQKRELEDKINALVKHPEALRYILPSASTRLAIAEASIGLGALVTFIGLYLGIIFLISSAAILALKELSEQADNKRRFAMLRSIGTDEVMINRALFTQIGIFFMFPLLVAIIHSIFGIKFCTLILETFGTSGLLPSIIMTLIFLIIIYGGYFLITYYCSKNIIKER